jgi:hypothetical protein
MTGGLKTQVLSAAQPTGRERSQCEIVKEWGLGCSWFWPFAASCLLFPSRREKAYALGCLAHKSDLAQTPGFHRAPRAFNSA